MARYHKKYDKYSSKRSDSYYDNLFDRYKTEVVLMWGDESTGDQVLYCSDQVMIFKFTTEFESSAFEKLESCAPHMPALCRMEFQYIHKANGYYNYIGKVQRLKILCVNDGVAQFEVVILMQNEGTKPYIRKYSRNYPCMTKNDVCLMRELPKLDEETSDKVTSVFI